MRMCKELLDLWSTMLTFLSIEHDDIHVVAINDPFIDPNYAVSAPNPIGTKQDG